MSYNMTYYLRFSLLRLYWVSFYYLLYLSPNFNGAMEGWLKVTISYKCISSPPSLRLTHDLTGTNVTGQTSDIIYYVKETTCSGDC